MKAPIPLQYIFSYSILANPEMETRAPNTCQSKLVPVGSITQSKLAMNVHGNSWNFMVKSNSSG